MSIGISLKAHMPIIQSLETAEQGQGKFLLCPVRYYLTYFYFFAKHGLPYTSLRTVLSSDSFKALGNHIILLPNLK